MTRIVGGKARGRRLVVPSGGTRPTSDRAREAVFSGLESIRGPWHGSHVADLYAGSGACGLEAASRGAARVDLVEIHRGAVEAIAKNRDAVAQSGAEAVIHVHRKTVQLWATSPPAKVQYEVVFCDPPYDTSKEEVEGVLRALSEGKALAPDALVVLERSARDPAWEWWPPFAGEWDRRYGEAHLWVSGVATEGDDEPRSHRQAQ